MRFLQTEISWYEDYWLTELRWAGIIARILSSVFTKFALACGLAASIIRAALVFVLEAATLCFSTRRRNFTMWAGLLLSATFILESTNPANAQCTARDVLQRPFTFGTAPVVRPPQNPVTSASDVAVWKIVEIGTFSNSLAFLGAMRGMGCSVGDAAAAVLAQPGLTVSATKATVELIMLSAAELGFQGETASLRQIYAFAHRLGFELAPVEIAPQLRLQYLDQPIGEFLTIGMTPVHTPIGDPVILTIANGGAGLILISQDGRDDAEIPVTSRFVFVRPRDAAPTKAIQKSW
jgi:hypothetical protein